MKIVYQKNITTPGRPPRQTWLAHQSGNVVGMIWEAIVRRKIMMVSLLVMLVTLPILYLVMKYQSKVEAAWFDDTFAYRQTVAITNAGTAQTDFQVAITLNTSALITAGKMQSDCDDVRITDVNGKVLPFWIETGTNACNTTTTAIWTKVPSISTSGTTVYLYYGNPSAINTQNGNNVFEFFDDFSGSTVDTNKWTTYVNGGSVSLSAGNLQITGNNTWNTNGISSNTSYNRSSSGYSIYWSVKLSATAINTMIGYSPKILNYSDGISHYPASGAWYRWRDNVGLNLSAPFSADTWYITKTKLKSSQGYILYRNGTQLEDDTTLADNNHYISMQQYETGKTSYFDFAFVCKSASSEPTVATPTNEEKSQGPVAYWKFDAGYSTVAFDAMRGNNGTITGATWQSEDKCISGKCLYFDGNDNVEISSSSSFNGNTQTIELWLKLNETSQWFGIYRGASGGNSWYFYYDTSGGVDFAWYNSSSRNDIAAQGPNTSEWHHFAIVISPGSQYIYRDGVQVSQSSTATGLTATDGAIKLGEYSSPGVYNLVGYLDEPKIYNYARTAAQIKADYNSQGTAKGSSVQIGSKDPRESFSQGLVGYWKMDESSWGSVVDSSGNGNNGTAYGGATVTSGKFGNGGIFSSASSQYVSVTSSTSLQPSDKISIATWVYWTGSGSTVEFITAKGSEHYEIHTGGGGGSNGIRWIPTNGVYIDTGASKFLSNQWNHLVTVYDSATNTGKVYVNGSDTGATQTGSGALQTDSTDFQIARRANASYYFNGKIDETRIYNRALSPKEVRDLYNWAPGPVLHLKMDENTGTTSYDTSGNANSGIFGGGNASYRPTWTQGKFGNGALYDGNDYIDVADSDSLRPAYGLTMETWVYYPAAASNACFICKQYSTGSANSFALWAASDVLYSGVNISITGGSGSVNHGTMPADSWVHIATTWDTISNTVTTYVNGVKNATTGTTTATSLSYDTAGVFIGGDDNDADNIPDFWNSSGIKQDDVRIYNYARNSKQIVEDMNAGHPAGGSPVGSQVGYWRFDEGYGTTNAVHDSSGQGNTGSWSGSGSHWSNQGKFGKAGNFNGTSDYVDVGNGASLNTQSEVTVTAWVKANDVGASFEAIYARGDPTFRFGISGTAWGARPWIYINGVSYLVDNGFAPYWNQWTYIAFVFSDPQNLAQIYINGKRILNDTNATATIPTLTVNGFIGQRGDGGYLFSGLIDEVKIYNSALTEDEIKLDYNHGSAMVLGTMGSNTSYEKSAANQEYCVPGDTISCAAPVGEWKFEEGTGISANDTSGNNRTGTLTGGPTWISGKVGKALSLDGDDNVSLTRFTYGVAGVTMSAWVKTSSSNSGKNYAGNAAQNIVGDTTGGVGVGFGLTGGKIQFCNYTTIWECITGLTNANDNNWHYITAIHDTNGAVSLYLDGRLDNTGTISYGGEGIDALGRGYGGDYFTGLIDNIRIYNYARTPAQIAWDYNRGGPVGWWKMDECQGTVANDSGGSGTIGGNPGTITIGASGTQTAIGTCTTSGTAWENGVNGKYNSSLNFDGSDDVVSFTSTNIINVTSGSVSLWTKPSSTQNGTNYYIFDHYGTNSRIYINSNSSGTNINGRLGTGTTIGSVTTTADNWHHVVLIWDGTNAKFYIDGIDRTSTGTFSGLTTVGATSYIGNYSDAAQGFTGQIDDVKIFNYALSPLQVTTLYNEGSAVRFGPNVGSP